MPTNREYFEIAKRLEEVSNLNKKFFDETVASRRLFEIFETQRKTFEPLAKEFERINSLKLGLPRIKDFLDPRAFDFARTANLAISQLSIPPDVAQLSKELEKANAMWRKQIDPIFLERASFQPSFLALQSEIARLSEISIHAERTLAQVDLGQIASLVDISREFKQTFQNVHIGLAECYSNLFKSFEDSRLGVLSVPPVVTSLPPIEFYINNRFIRRISEAGEESEEDNTLTEELDGQGRDELASQLLKLDPALVKLWYGAREAQRSDNPDAIRHFSISLRELLTQVIHRLAPDDDVKSWSTRADLYHNGRPTRKARLLYICRGINHDPFDQFLVKDIDAVIACMDVFQQGTHEVDPNLAPTQLELLRMRTESSIRFIIKTLNEASGA